MNRLTNFIKTTAIGGLLVIVPIAIIVFILARIFYGMLALSKSVVAELGLQIDDALIMVVIALASLIGLCFLTGLLVRTRLGVALGTWMNRNVGRRIPMFNAISSLTKRFVGLDGNKFAPVEVDLYGSDARVLGFLIEQLPDERCAVFVPSAPVATVGNIHIVPLVNVKKLDASVTDMLTAISQWGVDSSDLYRPDTD
jgi:uncharacterized membrane protein